MLVLAESGTSRAATMSCDWEGNRRSGVALAMCHRLEWFIHLRAQGLSKGDEHPTNTPHGVWYSTLLWSPYVIGQTIIFLPCDFYLSLFFFLLSFFPRLISAAIDWMCTILPHMVWP